MLKAGLRKLKLEAHRVRYGHPRGLVTNEQYRRQHPERWLLAVPREARERRPPRQAGKDAVDLISNLDPIPELGVTVVPNGSILGPEGWVFTEDAYFLADNSWYGQHAEHKLLPRAFPKLRKLRGTCLSLASDWASVNYAHFMLDCLGRFALFEKAGLKLAEVDHVYCSRPPSKTAWQLLEAVGVPIEKCLWNTEAPFVRFDRVLAPSFPGTRRNYPPWLAEFLRRAAPPASGRQRRRVYVPRGSVRGILNEAEIVSIAGEFGVEVYDYRRDPSALEFFPSAELVVGAHGAGLANIAFCKPSAQLLELFPSDHVFSYYYTLAEASGLGYSYLVGESTGRRAVATFGPSPFDFRVDPHEFREALRLLPSVGVS